MTPDSPCSRYETSGHFYTRCEEDGKFNVQNIGTLYNRLGQSWPIVNKYMNIATHFSFWGHEWNEHGTCYIPMFNQTTHFGITLNLFQTLSIMEKLQNNGM